MYVLKIQNMVRNLSQRRLPEGWCGILFLKAASNPAFLLHSKAPSYLADYIRKYVPRRTLRSQETLSLVPPRIRTATYGSRSFTASAPKLWNSLPNHLKDGQTLSVFNMFKCGLKTHLFKNGPSINIYFTVILVLLSYLVCNSFYYYFVLTIYM